MCKCQMTVETRAERRQTIGSEPAIVMEGSETENNRETPLKRLQAVRQSSTDNRSRSRDDDSQNSGSETNSIKYLTPEGRFQPYTPSCLHQSGFQQTPPPPIVHFSPKSCTRVAISADPTTPVGYRSVGLCFSPPHGLFEGYGFVLLVVWYCFDTTA